jgi:tellurium resistance protein TerD
MSNEDLTELNDPAPKCPKCGSRHITLDKKGYEVGNGCCGAILLGPIGLLCGAVGANDKKMVCMSCGHEWDLKKR